MTTSPASKDYSPELRIAVRAARKAADILRLFRGTRLPTGGDDDHCQADTDAESCIRDELDRAFPQYGTRGEELSSRNRTASDGAGHYWSIDPNDGTKWFSRGYRGSSVSIALLRAGTPILGVVYAYAFPDNFGDLITWAEGLELTRNGRRVVRRTYASELAPSSVVLLPHGAELNLVRAAKAFAPARVRTVASIAYRLALVAVGDADATLSAGGPVDWDYAAGHALLAGSGGVLLDGLGNDMPYAANGESHSQGACFGAGRVLAAHLANRPRPPRRSEPQLPRPAFGLQFPCVPRSPGYTKADPLLDRGLGSWIWMLALGAQDEVARERETFESIAFGIAVGRGLAGQDPCAQAAYYLARSLVLRATGCDELSTVGARGAWILPIVLRTVGLSSEKLTEAVKVGAATLRLDSVATDKSLDLARQLRMTILSRDNPSSMAKTGNDGCPGVASACDLSLARYALAGACAGASGTDADRTSAAFAYPPAWLLPTFVDQLWACGIDSHVLVELLITSHTPAAHAG